MLLERGAHPDGQVGRAGGSSGRLGGENRDGFSLDVGRQLSTTRPISGEEWGRQGAHCQRERGEAENFSRAWLESYDRTHSRGGGNKGVGGGRNRCGGVGGGDIGDDDGRGGNCGSGGGGGGSLPRHATPLLLAVSSGRADLVELLVRYGGGILDLNPKPQTLNPKP